MSKKERGRAKEKKTCILASPQSFVIIITNRLDFKHLR